MSYTNFEEELFDKYNGEAVQTEEEFWAAQFEELEDIERFE